MFFPQDRKKYKELKDTLYDFVFKQIYSNFDENYKKTTTIK